MVLNTQFMGKFRTTVMSAMAGLALAGCNEARANENTQAEVQKVVSAVIPETQAECLKLQSATQEEIMTCMRAVTERDKLRMDAEIAALDTGLKQDAETIAKVDTDTETEKAEGEKLDTTIEGLSKVVELQEE